MSGGGDTLIRSLLPKPTWNNVIRSIWPNVQVMQGDLWWSTHKYEHTIDKHILPIQISTIEDSALASETQDAGTDSMA